MADARQRDRRLWLRNRVFPVLIVLGAAAFACLGVAQTGPLSYRTDYAVIGPGGDVPGGLVIADLNHDGHPDFMISDSSGVSVFLGNGNGGFQSPVTVSTTLSGAIAAADFDGDGNVDLLIWNERFSNGPIYLLPGNGDGTFGSARQMMSILGTGAVPYLNGQMAVADLNHDGLPDIVVLAAGGTIDSTKSNTTVLLNNGDGTFSSRVTFEVPTNERAISVVIADFNRDGTPDLAVMTSVTSYVSGFLGGFPQPSNVYVALGNGDGSFKPPLVSSAGQPASILIAGDFNNDGAPDLAAEDFTIGTSILLGNGDGTFRPSINAPLGGGLPGTFAAADFTGDGTLDLATWYSFPLGVGLLTGNGDGTFQTGQELTFGEQFQIYQIVAADLNGDGHPDLVVTATTGGSTVASVFLNSSGGPPPNLLAASAASGVTTVAPGSIASVYGASLAAAAQASGAGALPLKIAGVTANVTDSAGISRPAPLFYVSPMQINLEIPNGTAPGIASVTVDNNGAMITGGAFVQNVAPGIFTFPGLGLAAAYALTYSSDGQLQPPLLVGQCQSDTCNPVPIPIPAGSHVFLELFATGIRNHVSAVVCSVFGQTLPVTYAGPQGVFDGLDQINVEITALTAQPPGADLELILNVDGIESNVVTFQVAAP